MSTDVCEGCRRLRKRCEKEDCVIQPCLEELWGTNRAAQGNATVFLAKYFGRKRFFKLLEDARESNRAALFESLLNEACARKINPVSGAAGLIMANKWAECHRAVRAVLISGHVDPATSSGTAEVTLPSRKREGVALANDRMQKAKRERDEHDELPRLVSERGGWRQNLNLDLNLSLQ